eukprot:Nk52_evm107s224 gene=Nk52_evmTU107s224
MTGEENKPLLASHRQGEGDRVLYETVGDNRIRSRSKSRTRGSSGLDKSNGDEERFGEDKIEISTPKLGTVWGSIGNLAATTMGAGILSLPVSLAYCGLYTGLGLMFLFAVFSDYSLMLLVRCAKLTNAGSLEEVGEKLYGRVGANIVKTVLLILLFGFMIVSVIVVSDSVMPLWQELPMFVGKGGEWYVSKPFITGMCVALMFPLTMSRSLSALKFSSWLAVFSVLYLIFMMVVKFLLKWEVASDIRGFNFSPKFAMAFPIQSVAFCSQFNVIPLYDELQDSHKKHMGKVIHGSILLLSLGGYVLFSVLGYLYFGQDVETDILMQFQTDTMITIARVGIALTLICKFPLVTMPFRHVLNDFLFGHTIFSQHFIFWETLTFVSIVYVLSLCLGELANAFALVGSTAGMCVCFVLPALFFLRASKGNCSHFDKFMCFMMIFLGVVSGVVSFYTTLKGLL